MRVSRVFSLALGEEHKLRVGEKSVGVQKGWSKKGGE